MPDKLFFKGQLLCGACGERIPLNRDPVQITRAFLEAVVTDKGPDEAPFVSQLVKDTIITHQAVHHEAHGPYFLYITRGFHSKLELGRIEISTDRSDELIMKLTGGRKHAKEWAVLYELMNRGKIGKER